MNKQLIDSAWSALPAEFKEEVKKYYQTLKDQYKDYSSKDSLSNEECDRCNALREKMALHQMYFGYYNLTSDAEGEDEMLCVSRKRVQGLYDLVYEIYADGTKEWYQGYMKAMHDLFGSKCLPDELNEDNFATKKPQPAEPKNEGTHQEQCVPKNAESGTHSFNHILKDSFRKERRLNIAAQIVASMIGSDDWTTWRGGSNKEIWHNMAKSSLEIAEALIAEAEKGGGNA